MQTVQIFSKLTIFDKQMNKNANKVQIQWQKTSISVYSYSIGAALNCFQLSTI